MNTGPRRSIDASHSEVAVREALGEARDARWRQLDEAAKPKRRLRVVVETKPSKKQRKAKPPAAAAPTSSPSPAALPPGSLVLSPQEVAALDHLLATDPRLRS